MVTSVLCTCWGPIGSPKNHMATPPSHCIIARLKELPRDCIQHYVEALSVDKLQSRLELTSVLGTISDNDLLRLQRWEAV